MSTAPLEVAPRVFPVIDEDLPHQIVVRYEGVSCNCRRTRNRVGSEGHAFFAPLGTAEQALTAYRDPANHRGVLPVTAATRSWIEPAIPGVMALPLREPRQLP